MCDKTPIRILVTGDHLVVRDINQPPDLPATKDPLTDSELGILRSIARSLTNEEISAKLSIHEHTVAKHVSNILSKLHLANRTQAALYALRPGLVKLD